MKIENSHQYFPDYDQNQVRILIWYDDRAMRGNHILLRLIISGLFMQWIIYFFSEYIK